MFFRKCQILTICILAIALLSSAFAVDSLEVSGKIIDLSDESVEGAKVIIGSNIAYTDTLGDYTIKVSKDIVLIDDAEYKIDNNSDFTVRIYNLLGQEVFEEQYHNKLIKNFSWKGINGEGKRLSSGIYFPVVEINNKIVTKSKVTIIGGKVTNKRPFINFQNKNTKYKSLAKRSSNYTVNVSIEGNKFQNIESKSVIVTDYNSDNIGEAEDIAVNLYPNIESLNYSTSGLTATITATATDLDNNLSQVEIYWDDGNTTTVNSSFDSIKENHTFLNADAYTITVTATDEEEANTSKEMNITVEKENSVPTASFTVTPKSGTINTEFEYDASGCSDPEDDVSDLQVRWDWNNDGNWDTDYSTSKINTHQYSSIGTYEINMEVKDSEGATDTSTMNVKVEKINNMIYVSGGTYIMGDVWGDGESDETPTHEATVSSFYMSKYEVTHVEYIEFLNNRGVASDGSYNGNELIDMDGSSCAIAHDGSSFYFDGSSYAGDKQCPVIYVTWYGTAEYCNWLSEQEGLTKAYTISSGSVECNWDANGYRLPTEAEWEYAARSQGRDDRKWSGTNSESDLGDYVWYYSNSEYESHPVGTKQPNDLGIFDMSGNVYEWCWDWYGDYSSSFQTNPTGPSSGSDRVDRGGGWSYDAYYCRTAYRGDDLYPSYSNYILGFRLTRRK